MRDQPADDVSEPLRRVLQAVAAKRVPALSAANVNEGFTLLVGLVGLAVRLTTGGTVSIV